MSLFDSASLICTPNGVKAGKLYSIKPTDGSGDLSVTRATSATRVNANGLIETVGANVPRLDYTNGSCPSILVEPQRTNLALRSEEFDNAYWTKRRSTITANATTSPDGTINADKLIDDTTASATHQISRNITGLSSGSYTMSVFAKKGEYNYIRFWEDNQTGRQCYFNLDNGTVTNVNMNSVSIENVGNGWYRCIATINLPSAGSFGFRINLTPDGTTTTYNGTGTNGVFIWGAQLEAGSNATSYIPTVASAVTRNADVISKTGISDLIGQTEGTLYANFSQNLGSRILALRSNNNQNRIALRIVSSSNLGVEVVSQGSLIYNKSANVSLTSNTFFKILVTYTNTKIKMFVNGLLVLESGVVNFSTNEMLSILALGISELNFATSSLNGSIKEAVVFKTALSDQECINLTTL